MTTETVEVVFPGGKQVTARVGEFEISTDQSTKFGGEASAPEPFDLFLASIATCAGVFALNFCHSRNLETRGLGIRMVCEKGSGTKLFTKMTLNVSLPSGFPEKYRNSLVKAVGLCTVKRHIVDAPEFPVVLE